MTFAISFRIRMWAENHLRPCRCRLCPWIGRAAYIDRGWDRATDGRGRTKGRRLPTCTAKAGWPAGRCRGGRGRRGGSPDLPAFTPRDTTTPGEWGPVLILPRHDGRHRQRRWPDSFRPSSPPFVVAYECARAHVVPIRPCCYFFFFFFSLFLPLSLPTFSSSTTTTIDLGRESHRLGLPLCWNVQGRHGTARALREGKKNRHLHEYALGRPNFAGYFSEHRSLY